MCGSILPFGHTPAGFLYAAFGIKSGFLLAQKPQLLFPGVISGLARGWRLILVDNIGNFLALNRT